MIGIEALKQQIKQSEARIANLRFELRVEESVINKLRTILDAHGGSADITVTPEPVAVALRVPAVRVAAESLAGRAASVLREHGGPMRARDITKALEARGARATGKTSLLALVIGALRRRPKLFTRIRRGVYALAEPEGETP